jgi:hypothetical protein
MLEEFDPEESSEPEDDIEIELQREWNRQHGLPED